MKFWNQGSPKRDRSSSPMDMDISDGESEDGQITKDEQEEERERRLLGTHKQSPLVEEPIVLDDLEKCRLTRDNLAKYCMAPWFQEYVQGIHPWFLRLTYLFMIHPRGMGSVSHRLRKWGWRVSNMPDSE